MVSSAIASRTSDSERKRLISEFRKLTEKDLMDTLNRSERCQLRLVRWELDRIREAEVGPGLETLKELAQLQRDVARDVSEFVASAKNMARPPRGSGRSGR